MAYSMLPEYELYNVKYKQQTLKAMIESKKPT